VGAAVEFLRSLPGPWVVKTDGLAAGKGVLVTDDRDAAEADVRAKLSGAAFGDAGRRVVIEEGLVGPELSVMAVCDGERAVALAPAQDFKRVGDGDRGPNTGGMGSYSPVPGAAGDGVVEVVMDRAVRPTLAALRDRGIDFRGVLYAGLMLTDSGPKVLEFNVRFGDPETQVVLPRWEGDVTAVLAAAAAGDLSSVGAPSFGEGAAVCVVLAADGYPEAPRSGARIDGLDKAAGVEGVEVYSAGVGDGLVTAGGRVLGVTAVGPTIALARQRAYDATGFVSWTGMTYRTDIAAAAAHTEAGV
jgi:phosphoribosylamine--glycine ligase